MRAAVLRDGQVTVRDTADPRPGPGQLLLKTPSCAICASDLRQFEGGPEFEDWYGTLSTIVEGVLDPLPSIGMVIGLDEIPEALRLARSGEGPPRIMIKPHGTQHHSSASAEPVGD